MSRPCEEEVRDLVYALEKAAARIVKAAIASRDAYGFKTDKLQAKQDDDLRRAGRAFRRRAFQVVRRIR